MTLKELKEKCEKEGFKYAYGIFESPTEPPHLVAISRPSNNLMADNKVYFARTFMQLDYTYLYKDIEEQNKIEQKILGDVAWNKTEETYLQDEKIWQVSYFFEI